MPAEQIERVRTTLQFEWLVEIRSPARGLVLARNVANGQRFEPPTELYRVADLGRVWILARASKNDAQHLRPGARVAVTHPDVRELPLARVSSVRPGPDPDPRTVEVCLETDNPGFALRPDMAVSVELPVELGPALTVPREALIGSEARPVVYLLEGDGTVVPRHVVTGFRRGDRVEIVSGLVGGEKVVTSGNFPLDSDSRMGAAEAR
jgi:Cu(I)/Ag(I) efflux system membrane fusion protein